MDTVTKIPRLTREDAPFGPDMSDYDLWKLFLVPEIAAIDKSKFPQNQSLKDILRNDTRIRHFKPGEVVVREGDYGNSAFLVLNGKLRVVLSHGLPDYLSGQKQPAKKSLWQSLAQLITPKKIPEVRDISRYSDPTVQQNGAGADNHPVFLQDFSTVLNSNSTALLKEGTLFGELAALRRIPRCFLRPIEKKIPRVGPLALHPLDATGQTVSQPISSCTFRCITTRREPRFGMELILTGALILMPSTYFNASSIFSTIFPAFDLNFFGFMI